MVNAAVDAAVPSGLPPRSTGGSRLCNRAQRVFPNGTVNESARALRPGRFVVPACSGRALLDVGCEPYWMSAAPWASIFSCAAEAADWSESKTASPFFTFVLNQS